MAGFNRHGGAINVPFSIPVRKAAGGEIKLDDVTDIYFHEPGWGFSVVDPGGQGGYAFAGKRGLVRLKGTALEEWIEKAAERIRIEYPDAEDFRIEIDGITWRCCRSVSELSSEISMRKIASTLSSLEKIETDNHALASMLSHPYLNDGGLVLVSGLNGSGKTTLCGAILRSRLEKYGGRCVSVEDPKELPLEGFVGKGVVRQMEVRYEDAIPSHRRGFAGAIRRAYRMFPAARPIILYVGEVRDEETAVELLKAASNGMLVITTVHAEGPVSAIERLVTLSSSTFGSSSYQVLASAIRLSIHSSLEWVEDGKAVFRLSGLFSSGPSHPTASLLRQQQTHLLGQVIEKQAAIFNRASAAGTPTNAIFDQLGAK